MSYYRKDRHCVQKRSECKFLERGVQLTCVLYMCFCYFRSFLLNSQQEALGRYVCASSSHRQQYIRGQINPVLPNPAYVNGAFNCTQPCTCSGHGDPNEYKGVVAPEINATWLTCSTNDTYCKNADNIDVVGPSSSRLIKACGGTGYPNGNSCPCQQYVDCLYHFCFPRLTPTQTLGFKPS